VDSVLTGSCEHLECQPCKGKVTQLTLQYRGSEPAYIEVYQKKLKDPIFPGTDPSLGLVEPGDTFTIIGQDKGTLSTEISLHVYVESIDETVITKIHTSCSQPIGPGMVFGDFLVLEGYSQDGGLLCPQESSDDCGCSGKVTVLTFKLLGDSDRSIEIYQKKVKEALIKSSVTPGEEFTITGVDNKGTMGTEISIFIDGIETRLHTSCSRPIGPGMVVGSLLEIVKGYSLDGGQLCPVQ